MIRIILNRDGSIVSKLVGEYTMIAINCSSSCLYVDNIQPSSDSDYWDFGLDQFVSIGEPPSQHYIFDYAFKQWVDPRALDDIKAQKWELLKQQRDAFEFGGFEFEGNIYDSDQVSQGRIMGAASAQIDQIWTLANNTTVDLTASQLMQLYQALQMHVAVAHERGRIAREAIQAATTKEQIEAIVF